MLLPHAERLGQIVAALHAVSNNSAHLKHCPRPLHTARMDHPETVGVHHHGNGSQAFAHQRIRLAYPLIGRVGGDNNDRRR